MYTHTTVISALVGPCLYKHWYLAGGHVMGKVPDSRHVILLVAIIATQNVVYASRVAL